MMAKDIPKRARKIVAERDGCCVRCGMPATDVHHRQRRREGKHGTANLIALCRPCHGWVHSHPTQARACGYIVPATGRATPEVIPALVREHGAQVWALLGDDRNTILGSVAQELLTAFGLIKLEVA